MKLFVLRPVLSHTIIFRRAPKQWNSIAKSLGSRPTLVHIAKKLRPFSQREIAKVYEHSSHE